MRQGGDRARRDRGDRALIDQRLYIKILGTSIIVAMSKKIAATRRRSLARRLERHLGF